MLLFLQQCLNSDVWSRTATVSEEMKTISRLSYQAFLLLCSTAGNQMEAVRTPKGEALTDVQNTHTLKNRCFFPLSAFQIQMTIPVPSFGDMVSLMQAIPASPAEQRSFFSKHKQQVPYLPTCGLTSESLFLQVCKWFSCYLS